MRRETGPRTARQAASGGAAKAPTSAPAVRDNLASPRFPACSEPAVPPHARNMWLSTRCDVTPNCPRHAMHAAARPMHLHALKQRHPPHPARVPSPGTLVGQPSCWGVTIQDLCTSTLPARSRIVRHGVFRCHQAPAKMPPGTGAPLCGSRVFPAAGVDRIPLQPGPTTRPRHSETLLDTLHSRLPTATVGPAARKPCLQHVCPANNEGVAANLRTANMAHACMHA